MVLPFAVITSGVGLVLTLTAKDELLPLPQLFTPTTEMLPDVAFKSNDTVMELTLMADVIVAPDGSDQL